MKSESQRPLQAELHPLQGSQECDALLSCAGPHGYYAEMQSFVDFTIFIKSKTFETWRILCMYLV